MPSVSFCTLGCRVNQYESSSMVSILASKGADVVPFGDKCDLTIVNTCTVTGEADRKSRQMIRRAVSCSRLGVIVCGCFSEISPDAAANINGVIKVFGTKNKSEAADAALHILGLYDAAAGSSSKTAPARVRSYIKVEDGCNGRCSYCIIPKARGNVRSKSSEDVVNEAVALVGAGAVEIILTGVELSAYGSDFSSLGKERYGLIDLMEKLSQTPGIQRLGLGSLDPTLMRGDFLKRAAEIPSLVRHFHLSIQSGSSSVLARMRRKYSAKDTGDYICKIRNAFPDAMISADIIVGFPGETEKEFLETAEFCREADFLNLHVFPYSRREGTEAAAMDEQIPESEKRSRVAELERIHRNTRSALMRRYADRSRPVHVLFEREKDGLLTGHTEHYVELCVQGRRDHVGKIIPVMPSSQCTGTII